MQLDVAARLCLHEEGENGESDQLAVIRSQNVGD